ncbi:unnamed protein product, partial [Heterotrigona itama]
KHPFKEILTISTILDIYDTMQDTEKRFSIVFSSSGGKVLKTNFQKLNQNKIFIL